MLASPRKPRAGPLQLLRKTSPTFSWSSTTSRAHLLRSRHVHHLYKGGFPRSRHSQHQQTHWGPKTPGSLGLSGSYGRRHLPPWLRPLYHRDDAWVERLPRRRGCERNWNWLVSAQNGKSEGMPERLPVPTWLGSQRRTRPGKWRCWEDRWEPGKKGAHRRRVGPGTGKDLYPGEADEMRSRWQGSHDTKKRVRFTFGPQRSGDRCRRRTDC